MPLYPSPGANKALSNLQSTAVNATIDMQTNAIIDLPNPTNPQDAATKDYVDISAGANTTLSNLVAPTQVNENINLLNKNLQFQTTDPGNNEKQPIAWTSEQPFNDPVAVILAERTGAGGAPHDIVFKTTVSAPTLVERLRIVSDGIVRILSNVLDLNANAIINVADPTNPQDAATKSYVDASITPPTGAANTVSFFNGSGALSSDAKFGFSTSNNNLQLTNFPASVTMSGTEGAAIGHIVNNGATMVTNGQGALILGFASVGDMTASNTGSKIIGIANDGSMRSSGVGSIAMGMGYAGSSGGALNEATGDGSITLGSAVTDGLVRSSGFGAFAGGVAIGSGSSIISSGLSSWVGGLVDGGDDNLGAGDGSFTFGRGLSNSSLYSIYLGRFADVSPNNPSIWVTTDPLFVLGNGSSAGARNNAFTVAKNGTQFIKDPSLATASVGDVRTLVNATTGETAWQPNTARWVSYDVDYTMMDGFAALTGTVQIGTLPDKALIMTALWQPTIEWMSTGASTIQAVLTNDTGTPSLPITAETFGIVPGAGVYSLSGALFTPWASPNFTGATGVFFKMDSDVDLTNLTQGAGTFWICYTIFP